MDEVISNIYSDGSSQIESETENVGTLTLVPSEIEDGVFLEYTLELADGSFMWSAKPFKTDESRKRVFFYYFYCEELFGCDMVATIEEDSRKKQVWSFFRPTNQNGQPTHRKVTWTLTKQ